jgi:hypothetical protein
MRSFSMNSLSSAWESGGRTPVTHSVEASVFDFLASSSNHFALDKVRLFPPAGGLHGPQMYSGSCGVVWHDPAKYMIGHHVFTLPLSFSTNDPITPALYSVVDKLLRPTSVAMQVEQCLPEHPETNACGVTILTRILSLLPS